MRHVIVLLLSGAALYATPQLRLSTSTIGPLNIAVGQNGTTQTVSTTNIGPGTLALSAAANVSWIAANIVGTNVQIVLNTSSLTQGIATGLVTVTAAGGDRFAADCGGDGADGRRSAEFDQFIYASGRRGDVDVVWRRLL